MFLAYCNVNLMLSFNKKLRQSKLHDKTINA